MDLFLTLNFHWSICSYASTNSVDYCSFLVSYFVSQYWILNSGPPTCQAGLARQVFTTCAMAATLFTLLIFQTGYCFLPSPASHHDPSTYAFVWQELQMGTTMPALFNEMGVLLTFCPDWSQSWSLHLCLQAVWVTGMCHHIQSLLVDF
jgi:hypothetical protein